MGMGGHTKVGHAVCCPITGMGSPVCVQVQNTNERPCRDEKGCATSLSVPLPACTHREGACRRGCSQGWRCPPSFCMEQTAMWEWKCTPSLSPHPCLLACKGEGVYRRGGGCSLGGSVGAPPPGCTPPPLLHAPSPLHFNPHALPSPPPLPLPLTQPSLPSCSIHKFMYLFLSSYISFNIFSLGIVKQLKHCIF
jgi:hypothetical protein